MINFIMNAIAKTAFSVAGKEISKKVIIGGAAGLAVAGGGATAGILIHKKHKKAAENQAPVEEAGAEKVDTPEAAKEETVKEDAAAEASDKDEKPQQQSESNVANDKTEVNNTVQNQVNNIPPIMNPNMNFGPYPAFQFANQNGINIPQQQLNPMYNNFMSGPLVGAPNFVPETPKVPEAPVMQETQREDVSEESDIADNSENITAADIAKGTVDEKINKSKSKKKK